MKVKVIAEIGSNWYHQKKVDAVAEIYNSIQEAKDAGADIVKFQIFTADSLYSSVRMKNTWEKIKQYEFPIQELPYVGPMCRKIGVGFWASVFSPRLAWDCAPYLDCIKIASGDIKYSDLSVSVAQAAIENRIPVAFSTGAATESEIHSMFRVLEDNEKIMFHCVSAYPSEESAMNLACIRPWMWFNRDNVPLVRYGLSDHSMGIGASVLAAGMGYTYFEKHFNSSTAESYVPDRSVSLGPNEFRAYVDAIRHAEIVIGTEEKQINKSEIRERIMARRYTDGLRPNTDQILE